MWKLTLLIKSQLVNESLFGIWFLNVRFWGSICTIDIVNLWKTLLLCSDWLRNQPYIEVDCSSGITSPEILQILDENTN